MSTITEKVLMRRMPATEKLGLTTSHFAETVQADNFPMPFRAHMERVVQRAEADNGLFQTLGAMTLIASISHWSERAREIPEIAAELETLAERFSKVDLPRNGAELQLLVRHLNALDFVPVGENSLFTPSEADRQRRQENRFRSSLRQAREPRVTARSIHDG